MPDPKYAERKARGLCVTCGGKILGERKQRGRVQCEACGKLSATRTKARQDSHKQAGGCEQCGKPRDNATQLCNVCRTRMMAKCARNRKKYLELAIHEYGDGTCICCGESNSGFLTLDHKDGGGAADRANRKNNLSGWTFYRWLSQRDWPYAENLRVMCYNCNLGRERNGGICPHKDVE